MGLYEKHIFICENEREPQNPVGCCASKGAKEISAKLKKMCQDAGLKGKVRINKSGCLGQCKKGIVMVDYPSGTWYQNVKLDDVQEIFEKHVVKGEVIERLVLKNP